jgi:GNAT superfamily N-acetyltransferase
MTVTIVEDSLLRLAEYASVPIRFTVDEVFDDRALAALAHGGNGVATRVSTPYPKDYDAHPGNRPTDWPNRFDLSAWTMLAASENGQRVGGAVVIYGDPQIDLLRDYPACALLWDLRVAPERRAQGVGSALLHAVEDVARDRGARSIRVETQQINVPACRFYARHGFRLERVVPGAYHDLPHELQLLWRKTL